MPIADYNSTRTWKRLYRLWIVANDPPVNTHPMWGQLVHYGRTRANLLQPPFGDLPWHRAYWTALTAAVTIPTNASLVFIGCGFGYLAEAAFDAGWTDVRLVDDSGFIDAQKTALGWTHNGSAWVEEPNMAPALQALYTKAPLTSNPNALRNQIGGRKDWVITESMLSSLWSPFDPNYDASRESDELSDVFTGCDGLVATGGTVLHIVSPGVDEGFHKKTVAEWKALNPAHSFVGDSVPISGLTVL